MPEVDPNRLAVTGASGGGTQTFILGALDPRPAISFPAVMVSTAMQGGCTCENCCLLRVGTGNVEIAALFAPKPMALSAANDWTKEMLTKGFPELTQLYQLYNAKDKVALISRTEFDHNFNAISRAFMYEWFKQHLGLDADIEEKPFERLTPAQMTVWNDSHPVPKSSIEFEIELLKAWKNQNSFELNPSKLATKTKLDSFREIAQPALDVILQKRQLDVEQPSWELTSKTDREAFLEMSGQIVSPQFKEAISTTFLYPKDWNQEVVLITTEQGMSGLLTESGTPNPEVQALLDAKFCVAGIDLFMQGEHVGEAEAKQTRRVNNPREAAGYTFGYNPARLVHQAHDIVTTLSLIRNYFRSTDEEPPRQVILVALGKTAPIAIAARAQAPELADAYAFELEAFRFANVDSLRSPQFLPGGAKYGDVLGMLVLPKPQPLWLDKESLDARALIQSSFQAEAAEEKLAAANLDWLKWIKERLDH